MGGAEPLVKMDAFSTLEKQEASAGNILNT